MPVEGVVCSKRGSGVHDPPWAIGVDQDVDEAERRGSCRNSARPEERSRDTSATQISDGATT